LSAEFSTEVTSSCQPNSVQKWQVLVSWIQ